MKKIRDSIVDGIFYSSEPEKLEAEIEEYYQASSNPKGKAKAILAPHAGSRYAWPYVASAFRSAMNRGQTKKIVLLGPVHREYENASFLPESQAFQTPLGPIKVDLESIKALSGKCQNIIINDIAHLEEHCLEIQLPFIKKYFPKAEIIPILIGSAENKNIQSLARALSSLELNHQQECLFIASANLSAFSPIAEAKKSAANTIELLQQKKGSEILQKAKQGKINSCGAGVLALLLELFASGHKLEILLEGDSRQASQDQKNGVCYAAAAFFPEEK